MTANKGQNRLTARRGARRRKAPTTSKTKGKSLAPALCRFVWNLTSQPMGADAYQLRQRSNKR